MIGASPVRAPKRNCAANPPAPWHIGIAPKGHSSTFARPEDNANRRSLAIDPVDGNSSRDRLAVTITALVSVRQSCGNTAILKLRQTSGQLGMMSCSVPGVMAAPDAIPTLPVTHPAIMAAASVIG